MRWLDEPVLHESVSHESVGTAREHDTGRPHPGVLAARVLAVVSLLAIAAIGLQGRRGLDWSRLTEAPDVGWAQLVLGGIGVALVLIALRHLVRVWRRMRPPPPEDDATEVEPVVMHWLGWVIGSVVVVAAMVASYLLLRLLIGNVTGGGDAELEGPDGVSVPTSTGGLLPLLLGLVTMLAVAALLTRAMRDRTPTRDPADLEDERPLDAATLAGAVVAAGQAMEAHDDTRAATIAAYRVMAAALARRAGWTPADTPTELLDRAVAAGLVSRGAALELTELFREARFSRHELPAGARHAAEAALARVSAELAVSRA